MRAAKLRKKDNITVLFVLVNLGVWKSESLYNAMLKHPKFNPIIVISKFNPKDNNDNLKEYCKAKEYEYHESASVDGPYWSRFKPDIIFFPFPYGGEMLRNLKSLSIYIPYAFHGSIDAWSFKTATVYNSWQVYYENIELAKEYGDMLYPTSCNCYATGLPIMDELLIKRESLADPWKNVPNRKRIIYAPHHSIDDGNMWHTSTFLEYNEKMLELAERYSDKVQWAFKPHPWLRRKLDSLWGKDKTDTYYRRWAEVEWSQYESGKYLGLFKYSDAMIHDCGSFVEEYHYSGNPVLYLVRKEGIHENWNKTMLEAFRLHYKASSAEEIERFIQNVISGTDPMKQERQNFVKNHLTPPFGKSACENIIDCILNPCAAKRMLAQSKK